MKHYLGIDFGLKKIGLAAGDDEVKIAFARPALLITNQDPVRLIAELCQQEQIDQIVVGVPQSTDGTSSQQTDIAQRFIAELRQGSLSVHTVDERFSTQGVQRQQRHRTLERGQEDSLVAQALLQSFLDSL